MNVKIELTNIHTKERLLQELRNIVENIEKFDRFDAIRNIPHQGVINVTKESEYAAYALIDYNTKRVIRYYTEEEHARALIEQNDHAWGKIVKIEND
jgi:hypothetical protein